MRTNAQNIRVEDSLLEQAQKNEAIHMLELSTQSAEEPTIGMVSQSGDTVLLCTDGLWKVLPALDIEGVINSSVSNPTRMSKLLIQAALEGGSQDHIGVIITQLNMVAVKAETTEKDSHLKV